MYRAEIAQGEKQVASLRRQQASYEARVNAIATEWNTLQADVTALAARVTGEVPSPSDSAVDGKLADATDPFLRRLFETAPGATRKRPRDGDDEDGTGADSDDEDEDGAARGVGGLDDDARRAVAALRARAAATKATLAAVLDAVDRANAAQTSSGAGDAALRGDLEKARARAATLEAGAAEDGRELERLRETTAKQRARNEELGKRLEDTIAEVELLRRSLQMARSDAHKIEGLPPMATAAGAAAGAAEAAALAAKEKNGAADPTTPAGAKTAGGGGGGGGGAGGATPANGGGGEGGADPAEMVRLEGEIHELKGRLQHATKQLDANSRENASLAGDLRALRDELADESRVTRSRPYESLRQQLATAHEDGARFRVAMSQLQRENENLRAEVRAASAAAAKATEAQRRAQLAEARADDAERRARSALDERDEAQFRLNDSQETTSRRRLNEERAAALEKALAENANLRAKVAEARTLATDLDAAKAALAAAETAAETARAEARDARSALEEARGGKAPEEGSAAATRDALAAAERKANEAEAKAKAAEERLAEKNAESEAFMEEVEAIGAAYEEATTENQRLMQRLTERDGTESKALSDKAQAQQLARRLRDDKAALEAAVAHERGAAQAATLRAQQIEEAANEQARELARAREESAGLSARMDEQTRTLRQMQETSREHREAFESAEKRIAEMGAQAREDASKVAAAERKAQQCEEQVAGLRRRCEKLAKRGGSADEYQEEIAAYKSMLTCSVCNDRPKGVVITRCFHMFCTDCINTRLENRDRKCPGCGAAFSASDVKAVFF